MVISAVLILNRSLLQLHIRWRQSCTMEELVTKTVVENTYTLDAFLFLRPDDSLLSDMEVHGGKQARTNLSFLTLRWQIIQPSMLTNFLPFSYLGLHGYLQLHPGRLAYDMNQSPEKRPRMSTKTGTLQTLTTGVNSLWPTTCSRIIRQIPRSRTKT